MIDAFVFLSDWASRMRQRIRLILLRRRYPYPIRVVIRDNLTYQLIYEWVRDTVPDHEERVMVDWVTNHDFLKFKGVVFYDKTYRTITGEMRFKDREHATMFALRFGSEISG